VDDNHPKPVEDFMTANLILMFVNMLWIFVAVWTVWGIGPVLILGAILNHLIHRLEAARRRRDAGMDRA
jgi:uncharacterized membrane protein YecN with MAPEG domain